MNKTILGLDLGTNSIGWALVEQDFEKKSGNILGMGSRIIPMSQDVLGDFGKGNSISQTAERTAFRGARRLRERHLLRRERLHRVLNILNFLPQHYSSQIDFKSNLGKFKLDTEPKIAYKSELNIETGKANSKFIFFKSFNEMLLDFKVQNPTFLVNGNGTERLIPYDWTIYYLRKKALTQKIEKEELAWILLNFNQKRGYYQLRGEEEEENSNKQVEFHSLRIAEVIADEVQKDKAEIWYSLILENGWIYRRSSKTPLFEWAGKVRDFIVTTELNDDGTIKTDKNGAEKRSFRAPSEEDWTLLKKKTEKEIESSKNTVGTYIYDTLLQNPKQKIKGKLVRTIERKFYKSELKLILQRQKNFHSELNSEDLYNDCVRELYRNNTSHQTALGKKDIIHLFVDDIIFYQRPLRSQKSSISNCTLESRKYLDKNGIEHTKFLKAIPKSNPYYQEFRIWQWIQNLSIYRVEDDSNVNSEFLQSIEDWENLFAFLDERKEIEQKSLIKNLLEHKGLKGKQLVMEAEKYRWNYVLDKVYPANETKSLIKSRLNKVDNISKDFLSRQLLQELWHIIYSVNDKIDFEKALKSFAAKHALDEVSFINAFKKFPPFKSEYGSFSEKAIKKLLPLLRLGKYWKWEAISTDSRIRIEKILNAEFDEKIKERVREKALHLQQEDNFQGLPLWLAQYIIYDRHSESQFAGKWTSADQLDDFIKDFKQHSLRNPIVEQVVSETLRVVRDIWINFGEGRKDFFDEIHVELGRDMKNTADERKRISNQVTENENTNLRIKSLLAEMINYSEVENVRPYSPMQQEILKVYEEGVLNSEIAIEDEILKISKTAQPSSSDLRRYKLWLEQKYRSPYTGAIIPLNKLFTYEYEIEHIIPQSRFFDDSFNNKVICESAVNKLKDNQIGLEFIKNYHGTIIQTGMGKTVQIFEVEEYEEFVNQHYSKNRSKRSKLLMEEIPEKMIERQMNDTRYISKYISGILSNIVRSETNDDGVNSKNLIPGNGNITNELKKDWGLNDVWNELILPRFERLNQIANSNHFTAWNENHQKFLPTVPLELSKGFSKKRIDHRHHALDALIIACATRDHVNLLNNQHAKSNKRFDLNRKLRRFEKVQYQHPKSGERIEREVPREFFKPWQDFTVDAKTVLESIIVSFKQNIRVINKATNYYEKWVTKDGEIVKEKHKQNSTNWAIRKHMHKDTVSGLVQLRKKKTVSLQNAIDYKENIVDKDFRIEIQNMMNNGFDKKRLSKHFKDLSFQWKDNDISKVEIYYWEKDNVASRVALNDTFDEKRIETITDTGIQKILKNHLNNYKGRLDEKGKEIPAPLLAFSPEGIEEMNKNIILLNDGNDHQPIFKIRTYEPKGNKFNVGSSGNKKAKYVEAAKGTNLFFAIYQSENGLRSYSSIPLNIVIERLKMGLGPVQSENQNGNKIKFYLSPNDLVYVPDANEEDNITSIDFASLDNNQIKRIYKMVSCTGGECHFVPMSYASPIINNECGSNNKNERLMSIHSGIDLTKTEEGANSKPIMIKSKCFKLNVSRSGKISLAIN